jgi:hypothetical protein
MRLPVIISVHLIVSGNPLLLNFRFPKKLLHMRKIYPIFIVFLFVAAGMAYFFYPKNEHPNRVPIIVSTKEGKKVEKKDGYDGPEARDQQEFSWMVDPALGYVPYTRLNSALAYTHYRCKSCGKNSVYHALAGAGSYL